jgi:hypothetical protein
MSQNNETLKSGNMEAPVDPRASLKIIDEMIETSKSNIRHNSIFFLLWGWLVLAASLIHFILIQADYIYSWIPWLVLMISGSLASVIIGYRLGRKTKVWSYFDKMMVYLWYGFFFTILIVMFGTSISRIAWTSTTPLIMALYGMGTFISGGILRFKPLLFGGIFCWICSLIAFLVPYEYELLLVAASMLVAYLIPGYMLQSK